MVPPIPDACTLDDLAADPIGPNSRLGTYTNFVNLLDLAAHRGAGAVSRATGARSGVTLIAPAGRDGLLAAIGRAHPCRGRRLARRDRLAAAAAAPPAAPAPPAGGIELAVVGAHLSGMPLNHELDGRGGASFVRAVATAPSYGLYALPGGPPKRPGLLRVGAGAALPIAVEVWALDPAASARSSPAIPRRSASARSCSPTGAACKGFLCEAEGHGRGRDITHFGGWRAYVASKISRKAVRQWSILPRCHASIANGRCLPRRLAGTP